MINDLQNFGYIKQAFHSLLYETITRYRDAHKKRLGGKALTCTFTYNCCTQMPTHGAVCSALINGHNLCAAARYVLELGV